MTGKNIRMRRIFKEDGKSVITALDFGAFFGSVHGLENPRKIVKEVVDGGADALIMTAGFARSTHDLFAGKAALILRVTGGTSKFGKRGMDHRMITTVQEAVALGADAIMNMIFVGSEHENEMFENMKDLSAECRKYGIVLFTELLPANFDQQFDRDWIDSCVRLGFEYGADAVKTYYPSEGYKEIIENCPIPVVMAGGPKNANMFDNVRNAISAGAAGVAIGRNIYESENPKTTVEELVRLVHSEEVK
jgi:class I fructose-bisphosphate aldolase/fructose-bisphosphate aldolase/2-amino-3,7-dideoxy-D-threo-hept-6-ulosonate synthase